MVHQKKWNSEECQMTGLLLVVCSMTLARRLQMHDHQSLSSNVEIAMCCRAESRTSSAFSVWSAELNEIFWCSAMDSFEDQKTELVLNSLRHLQPMKSITQQTRYGCQPTRTADKSRCCIHHLLKPIQSMLWTVGQQTVTVVNPVDDEAVDHRPCYVKRQQFQWVLHPPQLVKAAGDHAAWTSWLNQLWHASCKLKFQGGFSHRRTQSVQCSADPDVAHRICSYITYRKCANSDSQTIFQISYANWFFFLLIFVNFLLDSVK